LILIPITNAVKARLDADATLATYATGGVWVFRGPPTGQTESADAPYITIALVWAEPVEHSQRAEGYEVICNVTTYMKNNGITAYTILSQIMERVHGNATKQSTFSPTYGLHNWQMSTASGFDGWTVGPTVADSPNIQAADDVEWMQCNQVFRCHIQRVCPTS
jgi:hypothetical protein